MVLFSWQQKMARRRQFEIIVVGNKLAPSSTADTFTFFFNRYAVSLLAKLALCRSTYATSVFCDRRSYRRPTFARLCHGFAYEVFGGYVGEAELRTQTQNSNIPVRFLVDILLSFMELDSCFLCLPPLANRLADNSSLAKSW